MIAVLLITALFVFISVYFYFRCEKLQRSIVLIKREAVKTKKENQDFSKAIGTMASNSEEFAKNRLQILFNQNSDKQLLDELNLMKLFIHNYALIFKESLRQKGKFHDVTLDCFTNQGEEVYKDFLAKIIKADSKTQRLWSSNNLVGFISLVEALLARYEKLIFSKPAAVKSTTESN